MKKQCKYQLVLDKKKPFIYFCIRDKGHKGKHRSYHGFPKITKTIYWENFK